MAAASLHFQSVCDEDVDKVLNDWQIYAKATRLLALYNCALVNSCAIEISNLFFFFKERRITLALKALLKPNVRFS